MDHGRFLGHGAAIQRGADGTRDGEPSDDIAERRSRHLGPCGTGRRQQVLHATPGPVGADVIAPPIRVRAPCSKGRAQHIDGRWIVLSDVVNVDPKALTRSWAEAGEKDVSVLHHLRQEVPAFVCGEIDRHRSFAAIGRLEERVHPAVHVVKADGHEPPVRVTGDRMLDLDDLRAPLGQDRALHRHEDVRRDF